MRHVFHLYIVRAERRDRLLAHLHSCGVEAKVHYPRPVHLQGAGASLGYRPGDFPVSEESCGGIITLPCHQHLTDREIQYAIDCVRGFYGG